MQRCYSLPLNKHLEIAIKYNNHIEQQPNRSVFIDYINKKAKVKLGSPYCQAFVSYCLDSAGYKNFKYTALAMAFKTPQTYSINQVLLGKIKIEKGDVLTWQSGTTIKGHTGFSLENWQKNKGLTIQANTSKSKDDRDGQGIFIKFAYIQPFNYFRIIRVSKIKYE